MIGKVEIREANNSYKRSQRQNPGLKWYKTDDIIYETFCNINFIIHGGRRQRKSQTTTPL